MLRVLLTGGGTGGHINPAIAIADTIRMNQPDAEIAFVGTKEGKESDLVPRAGYPLYFVESKAIDRSSALNAAKGVLTALVSPFSKKTREILRSFQPDVVIGTGGYVCWPLLMAAALAGVPTTVHESNSLPGLAVRQLQFFVKTILLNFPEAADRLIMKKKCVTVGNPLRGEFGAVSREEARRKLGLSEGERLVLCTAGSLGSTTVNEAVLAMFAKLAPDHPSTRFCLSTGTGNFETAKSLADSSGLGQYENVSVEPYIYDMPLRMSAADVVISRAGAMSLSELSRMGKACVVVPSPYVADNHQLRNAQAMADRGGAVVVEEKDFALGALTDAVEALLSDDARRTGLGERIREFSAQDANRLIYEMITAAVSGKRK